MENQTKITLLIKSLDGKVIFRGIDVLTDDKPVIVEMQKDNGEKDSRILKATKKGNLVLT